jgi:putative phosphoribosyl transferase
MTIEMDNLVEIHELRNSIDIFRDREHAGAVLADMMSNYRDTNSILFGIPAGGVPVTASMASKLNLHLDVVVVSKITLPWNNEAGYGAVAFDGTIILNQDLISLVGLYQDQINKGIENATNKVERRFKSFSGNKPFPDVKDFTTILVDDGIASGYTMLVAVKALKKLKPKKIVIAVPTAHLRSLEKIVPEVDLVYCSNVRDGQGFAVADAYKKWYDVSEDEVIDILKHYK